MKYFEVPNLSMYGTMLSYDPAHYELTFLTIDETTGTWLWVYLFMWETRMEQQTFVRKDGDKDAHTIDLISMEAKQ